jgi:hypothetical protein
MPVGLIVVVIGIITVIVLAGITLIERRVSALISFLILSALASIDIHILSDVLVISS